MRREREKKLDPASDKALDIWERQNEIRAFAEPDISLRAKTQTVSEAIPRFMGENFTAPQRLALGLIGNGEVEQVIEQNRPVAWAQNAPGPLVFIPGDEDFPDPSAGRQQNGAFVATDRQRLIDQTVFEGEPGGSALSIEDGAPTELIERDDGESIEIIGKKVEFGEEGGEDHMGREREERGERRERGEEREERWMQRLITEQQETIDTQAETIETLVHQLGEEEEDEERRERRGHRRDRDRDRDRGRGGRGGY